MENPITSPDDIHILIIANNLLARAGLAAVLESQPNCVVVGQGNVQDDLDTILDVYSPDIILVDFSWDHETGIRYLASADSQDYPIVGLIAEEEHVNSVLPALQMWGNFALLNRENEPSFLAQAIHAVYQGFVVVDPELQSVVFDQNRPTPLLATESPLTDREQEVLALVAEGYTNKAIAQQLQISDHTVKFHLNSIMTKLKVQSRTEAVVVAAQQGFLTL